MVREAQAHAAEDRRLRELVDARNQGDALIHHTRKALTEYGEKLDAAEKREIEAAIRELEDALKGPDREEIQARIDALATTSQKLGERIYADKQPPGSGPSESAGPQQSQQASQDDDVIDAEFREVGRKR